MVWNYGSSVLFGSSVKELQRFCLGAEFYIQVGYGSYDRYYGTVIMVVMYGGVVMELWKF